MLNHLSLDAVISGCRDESYQKIAAEVGYCYELFRRALEEQIQPAWEAIERQYRRLLLNWIGSQASELMPNEVEEMAWDAFEKFWRTLSGQPGEISRRFPHVGALLRYLQQCAVTTVLDHRRQQQRILRLHDRLVRAEYMHIPSENVEDAVVEIDAVEKLARLREWIQRSLTDPLEKLVIELSFVQELSPVEIAERHPDRFTSPQEVRRIKERLLKRARRALVDPIKIADA